MVFEYQVAYTEFHMPSEHQLEGKEYDLELQIYCNKSDTEYLALAFFFDLDDGKAGNNWLIEAYELD